MKFVKLASSLLFASLFLVACGKKYHFDQTYQVAEEGWYDSDSAHFETAITDSMTLYSLALEIKHTEAYAFQNCYFKIVTTFPNGERLEKQVNVDFANLEGKWYGNSIGGNRVLAVDIQKGAFFNQLGKYQFDLFQNTRNSPLLDIKSVRFIIEDTHKKRMLK